MCLLEADGKTSSPYVTLPRRNERVFGTQSASFRAKPLMLGFLGGFGKWPSWVKLVLNPEDPTPQEEASLAS